MEECYKTYLKDDTELIKDLEKEIFRFFDEYKVNEWNIPALINKKILEKCGYFSSMPHQLTMVTDINDIDNKGNEYYLTPAACLHLYPHVKNAKICNELITTGARVYRYENGNFKKEIRMWDFYVRECVAVGDERFVKKFLDDFMEKTLNLARRYELTATIVRASDHFYPSPINIMKQRMQMANNLKNELRVEIDGESIAIASFNYHQFHFSRTFGFDNNNKIVTGCVGFGIDRWIKAIRSLKR